MRIDKITILILLSTIAMSFALTSCSEWTEEETVGQRINGPEDQNPEQYAAYLAALRAYKQSTHYLTFARMNNAPEVSVSERDFLRSMPDSLDIVSLRYGEKITNWDVEDIPGVQRKGTRVLYGIASDEWVGEDLNTYFKAVIDRMNTLGLDGISIVATRPFGEQEVESLVSILGAVAGSGSTKLLVFEGSPEVLSVSARAKFDYFILPTDKSGTAFEIQNTIRYNKVVCDVDLNKILLCALPDGNVFDANNKLQKAIGQVAEYVFSMGPVAGLGVYDIDKDYALNTECKYKQVREAIKKLNPSPNN